MRLTPTPFDPDSVPTTGLMLSDVMQDLPEAPAPEQQRGTSAPLNKREKWQLSELAQAAHTRLAKMGLLDGEDLRTFRGRVSVEACGKRISAASHGDRMLIQAAFLDLMGRAQQAARAKVKAATTALDIAKHSLAKQCKERGLSAEYADGIARRIYKRPVCSLTSAKEVWTVFYTVTNNANARDGKSNAANRFKSLRAKRQPQKTASL